MVPALRGNWAVRLCPVYSFISRPLPGVCGNWPIDSNRAPLFPRWITRKLSACTRMPHREASSLGGPSLFSLRIPNRWGGGCESFAQTGNGIKDSKFSTLSTKLSLHLCRGVFSLERLAHIYLPSPWWPLHLLFAVFVWTTDLDHMIHMNNSRYNKEADFGRHSLLLRNGLFVPIYYHKTYRFGLAATTIRFRKSLEFLDVAELTSKVSKKLSSPNMTIA